MGSIFSLLSAAQLQWCKWSNVEQSPGKTAPPAWASVLGWNDHLTTKDKTQSRISEFIPKSLCQPLLETTLKKKKLSNDENALNVVFKCTVQSINKTFCCIENGSRLSTTSLPVDTVWQGSHKVLFGALHDLLTHLMKLLGVVDPTVKLCICIRELCSTQGGR